MTFKIQRTHWAQVRFGDVVENISVRIDDPSKAEVDRYVGLEHLDPGSMVISRWGQPSDVEATKLLFQVNDVIFGRRRAYQKKVARADFPGICSAHALVLRARPDVMEPSFLPVFLSSDYFLDRAVKISVGSLSPTVNWKSLVSQDFYLPPIQEQTAISKLLWSIADYKNKCKNLISSTLELRRSWISESLANAKQDCVSRPLGSIAKLVSGSGFPHEHQGRSEGIPVIKVSDFGHAMYVHDAQNRIENEVAEKLRVRVCPPGTVVFAKVGAALLGEKRRILGVSAGFDNNVMGIVPGAGLVPEFLYMILENTRMASHAQVGVIPSVNQGTVSALEVPVPSLSTQQSLAAALSEIDQGIEGLRAELEALECFEKVTVNAFFNEHIDV